MSVCYYIQNECERVNYYITDDSDELKTIKKMDMKLNKSDKWIECYSLKTLGYDEDLEYIEILKLFRTDFNKWNEEMKSLYPENNYHHFNPKNYSNNHLMVKCLFDKYSSKLIKQLGIQEISKTEAKYQESTYTAGIIQLFKTGLSDCYGYDFSGYYQNIMGNKSINFYIPIKEGKEKKYTLGDLCVIYRKNKNRETHEKLPFGYYFVSIKSTHPDVKKVFAFSEDNCYTHTSLIFALQYKNLYKFEIEMLDLEYNSLIYDKKDIIKASDLFGEWFEIVSIYKKAFPKNKIIKYLGSSLWGKLSMFNRQFITIEEWEQRDDIGSSINDKETYYVKEHHNNKSIEIINRTNMYKNNLARLKSFITAYARDYVGRMIITEKIHDKVIRIHTDGITLLEPHEFKLEYKPIPEKKSTGWIYWNSNTTYYHKCDKCNEFYKYCSIGCPECN